MIYTYLADVTPLLEKDVYEKYYQQVPAWRQEKADRLTHQTDKAQSIGAWALLQAARKETGAGEGTVYNLSHSGGYALCAFSDTPGEIKLGCDIERMKEARLRVAERFFCEREYAEIMNAGEEKRDELFCRYWVLKESFIKATGQGMKLSLKEFEIRFDESGQPVLVRQPETFPENYYYKEYPLKEIRAKIAVCSTEKEIADAMREISFI